MNENKATNTNALFRIAGVGASLAFGAMVGSLFAVKAQPGGLTFELNTATIVAFFAAAIVGWFYWRMVTRMAAEKAPQQRRKKFIAFSVGLILVGIVSFL